jgi:hypothetical protein
MTKKNEKEYVDPLLWQLVDLGIGAAKETLTEDLEAHIGALHLCSVINADTAASPSKSTFAFSALASATGSIQIRTRTYSAIVHRAEQYFDQSFPEGLYLFQGDVALKRIRKVQQGSIVRLSTSSGFAS